MNEGNLVRMFVAPSAKTLVMGQSLADGGDALSFLQNYHLPPSVIPDVGKRESILDSSSTFSKTPSHKNLKSRDS